MRKGQPKNEPLPIRFARFFEVGAPDECWPWVGSKSNGYGTISVGGRRMKATHVAIHLAKGLPLDKIRNALHSCDNPPCVNPAHLREGTQKDNAADRDARGRRIPPKREGHGMAILNEAAIADIRSTYTGAYGELTAFGRKYGVTPTAILHVVRGKNWKS